MATLKDEVVRLQEELGSLQQTAQEHKEVSSEYLDRLQEAQLEAQLAIEHSGEMTEGQLEGLRDEVAGLHAELARTIGSAALVIRGGQKEIAEAIKSQSMDAIPAAVITGVFGVLASALLARGLREAGESIKPKAEENPLLARRRAAIYIFEALEKKGMPMTFAQIVDELSNSRTGLMTTEEARLIITNLLADGILVKANEGDDSQLRLNRKSVEVRGILTTNKQPRKKKAR